MKKQNNKTDSNKLNVLANGILSQTTAKMRVQKMIDDNTRTPAGRFGVKELNEVGFLRDLFKKYTLIPITKNNE